MTAFCLSRKVLCVWKDFQNPFWIEGLTDIWVEISSRPNRNVSQKLRRKVGLELYISDASPQSLTRARRMDETLRGTDI